MAGTDALVDGKPTVFPCWSILGLVPDWRIDQVRPQQPRLGRGLAAVAHRGSPVDEVLLPGSQPPLRGDFRDDSAHGTGGGACFWLSSVVPRRIGRKVHSVRSEKWRARRMPRVVAGWGGHAQGAAHRARPVVDRGSAGGEALPVAVVGCRCCNVLLALLPPRLNKKVTGASGRWFWGGPVAMLVAARTSEERRVGMRTDRVREGRGGGGAPRHAADFAGVVAAKLVGWVEGRALHPSQHFFRGNGTPPLSRCCQG